MSRRSRWSELYLLVALPFIAAACAGEPTGLGDPSDGRAGEDSQEAGDEPVQPSGSQAAGYARVVFTQSGELGSALLADAASLVQASVASAKAAGVSEDQIEAIQFTLTGVQLHRLGAVKEDGEGAGHEETGGGGTGEGQEGTGEIGGDQSEETGAEGQAEEDGSSSGVSGASWVTVELAEGTMLVINLTELPAEVVEAEASSNGTGLEIAAGELPGGTYKNVRLLGEATITFTEDLAAANADFVAGEAYPLEIPSSQSSGVKVQTPKFEIEDGGTAAVTIVFDGPASIKKIKLQPGGAKMVPVMQADVEVGTPAAPESPAP